MARTYRPGVWRGSPLAMPRDLKPSVRPLTIVCGPPAAGKTTWAHANAEAVIDLDEIMAEISGYPLREAPVAFLAGAFEARNEMLRACATDGPSTAFIVSAPEAAERIAWRDMLEPRRVVVISPGADECRRRILADTERNTVRRRQITALRRWYALYTPAPCDESIGAGERARKKLSSTARWRRLRAAHLQKEPLCRMCLAIGLVNDGSRTSAGEPQRNRRRRSPHVDHVFEHHDDPEAFWTGELQTLCADHHDGTKQAEEYRGYNAAVGLDGRPLAPNHPGYR